MINLGKKNVLNVLIDAVDYEAVVNCVIEAAREERGAAVSALAVHGVMTGALDREHRYRLNHFDLLVPDGQPVRWGLNLLYKTRLRDRVYGPDLMLAVCAAAEKENLPVYFYGSTDEVLSAMRSKLETRFPELVIAGMEPSRFRRLSHEEKNDVVTRIRMSRARIVFVALGCPRQEVWAYEFRGLLSLPILAVGAAFAFHAGTVPQAPKWLQDQGLEWLFRLYVEPGRLWRRYLLLNPIYVLLLVSQAIGLWRFTIDGRKPCTELRYG